MDYNIWIFPHLVSRVPIPNDYDIPPTIYSILNSYVNFGKENKVQIKNLAKQGRQIIFDFDYPIADGMTREEFECMILNHYMMRRIGYDTMTAFKLALNVKLNEIMPMYVKLFHAINGWEIFVDGEVTTREVIDSRTINGTSTDNSQNILNNSTNSQNTSDRRFSDTPENLLDDVKNGNYVSQYNYDSDAGSSSSNSTNTLTSNGTTSSTDSGNVNETIKRTPADKMTNYIQFVKEKQNIYTMIFKDLDSLFYQII